MKCIHILINRKIIKLLYEETERNVWSLFILLSKGEKKMSLLIYWVLLNLVNAVTPGQFDMVSSMILGVIVWLFHISWHNK